MRELTQQRNHTPQLTVTLRQPTPSSESDLPKATPPLAQISPRPLPLSPLLSPFSNTHPCQLFPQLLKHLPLQLRSFLVTSHGNHDPAKQGDVTSLHPMQGQKPVTPVFLLISKQKLIVGVRHQNKRPSQKSAGKTPHSPR